MVNQHQRLASSLGHCQVSEFVFSFFFFLSHDSSQPIVEGRSQFCTKIPILARYFEKHRIGGGLGWMHQALELGYKLRMGWID